MSYSPLAKSRSTGVLRSMGIEQPPASFGRWSGDQSHDNPLCRRLGCPYGEMNQPARMTLRSTNGLCIACCVAERKRLAKGLPPFPRRKMTRRARAWSNGVADGPQEGAGGAPVDFDGYMGVGGPVKIKID